MLRIKTSRILMLRIKPVAKLKSSRGVKKVRGQSEAALQTGATKNFDIS